MRDSMRFSFWRYQGQKIRVMLVEFPVERLFTFGIRDNGASSRFEQLLEVGMERTDHIRHMRSPHR